MHLIVLFADVAAFHKRFSCGIRHPINDILCFLSPKSDLAECVECQENRRKINDRPQDEQAYQSQGDLDRHDGREHVVDPGMFLITKRDLFGGGNAEAIIGKDYEILNKGLGKSDQAEFGRSDDPKKIRQDDDRQKIHDGLQPGEKSDVVEDRFAFVRIGQAVGVFHESYQEIHTLNLHVRQSQIKIFLRICFP